MNEYDDLRATVIHEDLDLLLSLIGEADDPIPLAFHEQRGYWPWDTLRANGCPLCADGLEQCGMTTQEDDAVAVLRDLLDALEVEIGLHPYEADVPLSVLEARDRARAYLDEKAAP